ncbi:MAG TPA: FMN-binding protein [Actinoplanes sp.]|nr:FMN-binding protein [Actinoplanes sp.]
MRRSTAAAVGTLTGAALIAGVRLSVSVPEQPPAAPPAVDLAGSGAAASAEPTPSKSAKSAKENKENNENPDAERTEEAPPDSGLQDGTYRGAGAKNPYGTIQVSIKVTGGKIVAADATYPTANNSAIINPPAIAQLKQATLRAQSADVDAVSGATFTSDAYVRSLQAALDQAGG